MANPGTWTVSNATFKYTWQHSTDGVGWFTFATGASVVSTASDLDYPHVRLAIAGSKFGWTSFSTTVVAPTLVTKGEFAAAGSPKVTRSGSVAKVTGTTWTPATGASEFLWRTWDASGASSVTTGASLSLADKAGRLVTVQEKRTASGFTTATTPIVVVQTGAAPSASGDLLFATTPRVGTSLAAPATTWTPSPTSVSYVWKYKSGSSWKAITGATASSYTPTAADLGRTLRVEQRPVATGYAATTRTTTATAPVGLGAAPTASSNIGEAPSVSGAVGINSTVTAHTGLWTPTPASFAYQWSSSTDGVTYTALPKATSAALDIPAKLLGAHLSVTITTKSAGYAPGTAVVDAGVVTGGSLTLTKAPVTSHTGTVYATTPGSWAPTPDDVGRTWYTFDSSGQPIAQSTDETIDVATLPNRPLAVRLTANATGFSPTTTGLIIARPGTFAPTQGLPVTTTGTSPVGEALLAPESTWGTTTPSLRYAWQYLSGSSWKNIAGATNSTFAPSGTYLGKKLRVVTTASFVNYTSGSATSAPVSIILAAAPTATGPSITGSLTVGSTVSAQPGQWTTTGLAYTYQWQAWGLSGYADISGARSQNYTIADKYFDKTLRVLITATKSGYAAGTAMAETALTVNYGTITNTKKPTVSVKKGVYTATSGTWSVTPGAVVYKWDVIDPATSSTLATSTGSSKTFTPAASYNDKIIILTVGVTRDNYSLAYVSIIARSAPAITPVTPLSIAGTAVVGETLTAVSGDWSTSGLSLGHQWYRNGTAIPGATASTYVQTIADVGTTISVKFIPTKAGYPASSFTVKGATTFSDVPLVATEEPVISGALLVESVLTATPGTWSVPGLTLSYQWYRANAAIPGATDNTYVVSSADRGFDLRVVVTATKKFHEDGAVASGSVNIAYGQFLFATAPTVISGTGALGSSITSEISPWNKPATLSFRWQRQAAGTSTWADVPGAGASTYTPTSVDGFAPGDSVRLRVMGSYPGHYDNYDASNAIVIQ